MHKYGLKLWSTNTNYIEETIRLYNEGVFQYIELYSVPGSYEQYISIWRHINIPYIIHAPHYFSGMNLARKENVSDNMRLMNESLQFADSLNADKIIVHPGVNGKIEETVKQLLNIGDKRLLVENKPYYGLNEGQFCNGATIEEVQYVLATAGTGFCLDLGHAISSANAQGKEVFAYLDQFFALKPKLFHLTDGDSRSDRDSHRHFGRGNYDLPKLLALIPAESWITVETIKSDPASLNDFVADLEVLKHV